MLTLCCKKESSIQEKKYIEKNIEKKTVYRMWKEFRWKSTSQREKKTSSCIV